MTNTTQTASQSGPQNAVVWAELPVSDLGAGMAFYSALLGMQMSTMEMGGDTVSAFPFGDGGVSADIFVPKAGQPKRTTVFLDVGKLEPAMERCTAAGGTLLTGIIDIPPGRMVHATDPDGNGIGLFERRS